VFGILSPVTPQKGSDQGFRWKRAEDDGGQPSLFSDEELFDRHVGIGEYRGLEFLHVNAKRIINPVPPQSRMGFRYTINAYRGCSNACRYCFARPTHEYLGLGIGEDFERKLVVKVNAVEKVKAELRSPKWEGDLVAMGTNTDPYQRAEGKYHLTRGIVEALGEACNPFSILTKGTLILRDVDVLTEAAERTDVRCAFSIGTLDEAVWKATEPGTPHPRRRVEAVRKLNEAGIPTGVLVAPILPGLSDRPEQLEEVTQACLDAGATSVTPIALHLRPGVKEHFLGFLDGHDPALASRLRARYGTRSYLPPGDQAAITAPVHAVLRGRR
jgi:DNA repair photolyase